MIGVADKGETAARDQFRGRTTPVPAADGRFIAAAAGGREPEKRDEETTKKAGDAAGL